MRIATTVRLSESATVTGLMRLVALPSMLKDIEAFATSLAKAARASRHTVSNYRRDLMSLRGFLLERGTLVDASGEVAVDAITADHVRQYLAELMRNAAARATVQRRLSALSTVFLYCESNLGASCPVRAPS